MLAAKVPWQMTFYYLNHHANHLIAKMTIVINPLTFISVKIPVEL